MTRQNASPTETFKAGSDQLEAVASMYAAFGAGDLDPTLRLVTEDVDWGAGLDPSVPGAALVPNFGHFEGPTGVVAYFQHVAGTVEFHRFTPLWMTTANDEVVALIQLELTLKASGRRMALEEVHRFRFNAEGRIDRYRLHVDTASVLAAAVS